MDNGAQKKKLTIIGGGVCVESRLGGKKLAKAYAGGCHRNCFVIVLLFLGEESTTIEEYII